MSKYFAYLIFLTFLTLQATGQDTIYFRNKKSLPINFRIVELKNGLIKVPVTENNNLLIYNYLPNDIDYIISYDTNYVKYLQKKDYDVYYFMAYRKDTSLIFYADHVEPNKEDVSKKILFKEKADSLARVEKRLIKKIKSVKQDSIYAGNVFSFKWAIEARNVIKYKSSRTDETVYYRYNSSTEYNSEKQILSLIHI